MTGGLWNGIPVRESRFLLRDSRRVQVRFPRSKRKRIRKKWRKDARNWAWREFPAIFHMYPGSTKEFVMVDPQTLRELDENTQDLPSPARAATAGRPARTPEGGEFVSDDGMTHKIGETVTAFDAAANAMGLHPWREAKILGHLFEDEEWWYEVGFSDGGRQSILRPAGVKP